MQEESRTGPGQEVSSLRSHNELCKSQASGKAINTALRPLAISALEMESGYKNRYLNKSEVTLNLELLLTTQQPSRGGLPRGKHRVPAAMGITKSRDPLVAVWCLASEVSLRSPISL